MPTYEYVCKAGHEFEQFQAMSARPLKKCTICGKPAKRKISAGGALLFKGSGFYITDYRSADYQAKVKSESGAPASGESKAKTEPAASTGDAAKSKPPPPAPAESKAAAPAPPPKPPSRKSSGGKKG